MKKTIVLFIATLSVSGLSQVPDVTVKLDMTLNYRTAKDAPSSLRFFDNLARPSIVSLQFKLEPGFRAFVAERLVRIRDDGDPEQLSEYYLEDPGIWRLGKQLVPFGQDSLIRMNLKAARGDLDLPFMDAPLKVALCDDGQGLSRGIVGRAGKRLGVSFGVGRNLCVQSSCLAQLKAPEISLGRNRGYQQVFGLDYSRKFGLWRMQAEYAMLRQGETVNDHDVDATDVLFALEPNNAQSLRLGWSREWRDNVNMYRVEGRFKLTRNLSIEPMVRYRNGIFFDAGLSLRVAL